MNASDGRRLKILRAQAMLDGELDATNALAFERDAAADPELEAIYRRLRDLGADVRASIGPEPAPEALRARILALAQPPAAQTPVRRRLAAPPLAWAASLAAVGVVLGALLFAMRLSAPGGDPSLRALIAGYMRGQVSGQPFDVASSDRHTVKPWLAARVTLGAAVIDLTQEGYPLAGGRIDIVEGKPVPTLVYRRREHIVTVSELPLAEGAGSGAEAMDGFHVERWSDRERAYVAISDLDASELAHFAEAFRRAQANP